MDYRRPSKVESTVTNAPENYYRVSAAIRRHESVHGQRLGTSGLTIVLVKVLSDFIRNGTLFLVLLEAVKNSLWTSQI